MILQKAWKAASAAALLLLAACTTTSPPTHGVPVGVTDPDPADLGEEQAPVLDRTQQGVENAIGNAASYIDSFFGETDLDEGANVTRGSLSIAGRWDERDGFDERIRLHARVAMPALKERTRLVFGRADAEEFADGTMTDDFDALPARFDDYGDDDWLLGVGYSRNQRFAKGWDFSLGIKLRTPLEPYARATYRWSRTFSDAWLWRVRPRVFVQSQRGAGASLNNTVDHALNDSWLLRSGTTIQAEDDVEGLAWSQQFVGYQSLSNRNAASYAVYAIGETGAEVPVRDYGLEFRFRRRIAREWLFLEFLSYISWPREFAFEQRKRNLGVGLEFDMQFGRWPGRESS